MSFIKPLTMLTLVFITFFSKANNVDPIKHDVGFKAYNTICIISVNDIPALTNYDIKGPVMAGVTMSAYLENGINSVALDMAPFGEDDGDDSYQENAYCELKTYEITVHKTSEDEIELFKLIGSVDENLQPTGRTSPDYEANQVTEQAVDGTILYRVSKSFEVSGLPEWTWTKAIPFEPTEENMQKLREAYLEVWQAINTKNKQRFKELSYISFDEKEIAANYPGSWYISLGFDKDFEESVGAMPINWEEYEVVILNKSRLVKLEDDDGFSPLRFKDVNGDLITSYNPYFSLIDGKMILTR